MGHVVGMEKKGKFEGFRPEGENWKIILNYS
jgi:hypothetical protein